MRQERRNCGVCEGADLDPPVRLRELMHLTGETFDYLRCRACGCLQIAEPPADIARYYAGGYYSFRNPRPSGKERLRDWLTLNGPSWAFGRLAWYRRGQWRSIDGIPRASRIADVGCGDGAFIGRLRDLGYANVCGFDAFAEADHVLPNGVPVYRKSLDELDSTFDVVMMHHSLEHMPDQLHALQKAKGALAKGGRLIVRIPVIDSWAADHFGEDWAALDPPRHFFLHTRKSIALLVERAGLTLDRIVDDWSDFGVRGSMLARDGKSFFADASGLGRGLKEALAVQRRACAGGRSDAITVHAYN